MFKNNIKPDLEMIKLEKFVNENASLKECLFCGAKMTSACNSHIVPRFILNNIAENGHVSYGYALSKIDYAGMNKTTGIKNAHTFRMICNDCDQLNFKSYEDKEKLSNFSTLDQKSKNQILGEMAIKAHIAHIDMKYKRYIRAAAMQHENEYANVIKACGLDISEHRGYIYSIKHNMFFGNDQFDLLYFKELPYRTHVASQTIINYCYDLKGNQVFDPLLLKNSNQCRYFYLMILPFENKTLVFFYIEKSNVNNVVDIIEQFEELSEDDKLHFLFISLIIHDQQIYLSPSLAEYIVKHDKKLERLYTKTEFTENQKIIAKFKKYNNYLINKNFSNK